MTKLNPYLAFPGTARQAIELYKQVFKTDPVSVSKFKEMPEDSGMPKPSPEGGERILHASFQIGNDMLMLSDTPEGQDNIVLGSQTSVSVHPDSREEADRMFKDLSDGGEVTMPMADAFWGDYFGMCTDKFGIRWMVNYHEEK
jgi:PhnB protein